MRWSVQNFKGLRSSEINIQDGKTTVLTGVNSSGKSSIIQSLLLAAQSLYGGGKIILNGPLVRLGNAQDLVREGAEDGAIGLALGFFSPTTSEAHRIENRNVHAYYNLVPSDEQSSLRARSLSISFPEDDDRPLTLGNKNIKSSDKKYLNGLSTGLGDGYILHLKSLLESEKRQLRTYVIMQGLKPVLLVQLSNPEVIFESYRAMLSDILEKLETGSLSRRGDFMGPLREVTRYFRKIEARSNNSQTGNIQKLLNGNSLPFNPYTFINWWKGLKEDDQHQLLNSVAEERAKIPHVELDLDRDTFTYNLGMGILENDLLDSLSITYLALVSLNQSLVNLANRVQYLGPLRDEPRVVWNHWNELARGLPVGARGEYSAAVLSRSGSRSIEYTTPGGEEAEESLAAAVDQWLAYLDIGENVSATSHGKLGVGLSLTVDGQDRDLTSVGVGVSQALPLVVGFLSAPAESIFIVEQPELHLHPAVQARLADFLLEARPDLTVILETHSEALITRIRRRAAEGSVKRSEVDITFVEPTPLGSTTRILELNEFGDLSEWPRGFLSIGEEDVKAIMQASINRVSGVERAG